MNQFPIRYFNWKLYTIFLFSLTIFFTQAQLVYAINDITIDGDLSDWDDENGVYIDLYGDSTPARTDITQYGLAIVDNGASPESLALLMVSDSYQESGNASSDSHQMIFDVGSYQINVIIQDGCDATNGVTINDVSSTAYSGLAISIITSPVHADHDPPDTTNDCALEIEFPISALSDLDSDDDGELLDEDFETYFIIRQASNNGNDPDVDDLGGLYPTAVTVTQVDVIGSGTSIIGFVGLFLFLLLVTYVTVTRQRDLIRYAPIVIKHYRK